MLRAIESEYSSSSSSSGYDDVNNVSLKKTVLLTTQADSETEKMFDGVDAVVKNKNRSEVFNRTRRIMLEFIFIKRVVVVVVVVKGVGMCVYYVLLYIYTYY